jgi:hypothetical protein
MSKIMRLMYAEARAAREAAANPSEHRMRDAQTAAPREWTRSSMNAIDPRFPLGTPLNRPAKSPLRPIQGRTNWFVDLMGVERYVEPKRPTLRVTKSLWCVECKEPKP